MLSKHQKLQGQIDQLEGKSWQMQYQNPTIFHSNWVTGSGCWYFMFANYSVFELRWTLQQMNPLDEDSEKCQATLQFFDASRIIERICHMSHQIGMIITSLYTLFIRDQWSLCRINRNKPNKKKTTFWMVCILDRKGMFQSCFVKLVGNQWINSITFGRSLS